MPHTTLRTWFRRFFQVVGPVLTTIGGLTDLLPGPYGKTAGVVIGTLTSLFVSPPGTDQKR